METDNISIIKKIEGLDEVTLNQFWEGNSVIINSQELI